MASIRRQDTYKAEKTTLNFAHNQLVQFNVNIGNMESRIEGLQRILWPKELLNRGERSNTYLTHVCRLRQSIDRLERIEKSELSVRTVTIITCIFFSIMPLSVLWQSVDMYQVGVGPFPPIWSLFWAFHLSRRFYFYIMIKMLKRREKLYTYLTHVCRHHHSRENPVQR